MTPTRATVQFPSKHRIIAGNGFSFPPTEANRSSTRHHVPGKMDLRNTVNLDCSAIDRVLYTL